MPSRKPIQTIRLVSFPNDLPASLPKPFYMLLMGTDKPKGHDTSDEFGTHITVAP